MLTPRNRRRTAAALALVAGLVMTGCSEDEPPKDTTPGDYLNTDDPPRSGDPLPTSTPSGSVSSTPSPSASGTGSGSGSTTSEAPWTPPRTGSGSGVPTFVTKSEQAGGSDVPAPARQKTKVGAEAFARFYFTKISKTRTTPVEGVLTSYALPSCKTCSGLEGEVKRLKKQGLHYQRDPLTVGEVSSMPNVVNDGFDVLVPFTQSSVAILNASGKKKGASPSDAGRMVVIATWTQAGWKVKEIQVA